MQKFIPSANEFVDVVSLIGGSARASSATIIHTLSDVTAYTANDVVGSVIGATSAITFAGIGKPNELIRITGSRLTIALTAIPASMTSFRLYLYDVAPPSALADNIAWDLPAGDLPGYEGYIDLGSPVDLGSNLFVQVNSIAQDITLTTTGNLYGYLVTAGGYTPASLTAITIKLYAESR
jgi:hypothetical protein